MNDDVTQARTEPASTTAPRRAYVAPAIARLGDVRELTLGGSPGVGDSGSGATQRCPGC